MSGEEAVDLLLWPDLDDDDEEEEDDRRLVQHSCKCSDNEENRRMIKRWIRELMLQNDVVDNKGDGDDRRLLDLSCKGAFLPRRHAFLFFDSVQFETAQNQFRYPFDSVIAIPISNSR